MSGLERIIEKIETEGRANAEAIVQSARQQAQELLLKSRENALKISNDIVNEADKEAKKRIAVARSQAESVTRNRYLEIRNAIVNDIISAAYEKIAAMPDNIYFDLMLELCEKNTVEGECVMYMNSTDLERMPKDFQDTINDRVFEKAAVLVSKKPMDIENGFVLVYGEMEINCTLRAVFDEEMDSLKDALSRVLFD